MLGHPTDVVGAKYNFPADHLSLICICISLRLYDECVLCMYQTLILSTYDCVDTCFIHNPVKWSY